VSLSIVLFWASEFTTEECSSSVITSAEEEYPEKSALHTEKGFNNIIYIKKYKY